MDTNHNHNKPNLVLSILNNKCAKCREGSIFAVKNPYKLKTCLTMHEKCPVCGNPSEMETGFYYGALYVSYGLTVAFCVFTFLIWFFTVGISTNEKIMWWLGINAVLLLLIQPPIMRWSRTLWMYMFVK